MKLKNYTFFSIILLAIVLRLIALQFYGDTRLDNEWGIILNNLTSKGVFGFREVKGEIFPNLFMPPLYSFFLYVIQIINPFVEHLVEVILYIHVILSIIAIFYFYRLLKIFFNESISLLGLAAFAFFPLNVFSVSQISSITLQIFLTILFFFYFISFFKFGNKNYLIKFSIISALLILLRGEFIMIYILTLILISIKKKSIKVIILGISISLIVTFPYLMRNYLIFDQITITKSFGYNLWKGNNNFSNSQGNEKIYNNVMQEKIENIKPSKDYDIKIDEIYKEEGFQNIKENPKKYIKNYFKKIFSFLFVDFNSTYPNYYNFLHLFPKITLSILSIIASIKLIFTRSILNYFSIYYIFNAALFSVFFILPRYSLMILPAQIIIACYLLKYSKLDTRN